MSKSPIEQYLQVPVLLISGCPTLHLKAAKSFAITPTVIPSLDPMTWSSLTTWLGSVVDVTHLGIVLALLGWVPLCIMMPLSLSS